MKDLYIAIAVGIMLLFAASLFVGFRDSVSKSFGGDVQFNTERSSDLKLKQKQLAEEAELQRRQFMEDHKQKMRDLKR